MVSKRSVDCFRRSGCDGHCDGAVGTVVRTSVTVLALRGNGIQFLIYGIGNLAAMAVWPLLKKRGWEALHGNVLLNIAFGALTVLAMQIGRALIALITGTPVEGLLLYVTADSVTYIFTIVILWIAGRLDGILEEQRHYLERINRPED